MPRRAPYIVRWSAQAQQYEITGTTGLLVPADVVPGEASWFAWLESITSFAFYSQSGTNCTVRKEVVQGSGTYWYGYRSLQQRTVKRYLGRTADLSLAHLEKIVQRFVVLVKPVADASSLQAETLELVTPPSLVTPLAPLLESKLRPPRLSQMLVARPRLHQQLDAWQAYKLALITAPAGFGKTTLVKSWLKEQPDAAFTAWVSLDAGDNDPIRFWRYILTACQAWSHPANQQALALLLSKTPPSLQPVPLEMALTVFLNQLTRQNQHHLLILEDYHVLTEPRLHASFNFLLAHMPETLHIMLITRQEPPLTLVRLRANGEIKELQASELRFTFDEMAAFLEQTLPVPLSTEIMERIEGQLDGWAAGLRLLSLSLQGKRSVEQIEQVLANFHGSQPSIRNYFVGEVLEAQSTAIQDFLLRTSILTRLSPTLCEAVTGQTDSAELLETIEQANLFLEVLDCTGKWYRYHGLFAEAMQHEARRRLGEAVVQQLYQAASHWFAAHDMLTEAVDAVFQLNDYEQAATLIERHLETLRFLDLQEHHTLRHWLERLPQPILHQHPILCFSYAVILLFGRAQQDPLETLPPQFEELLHLAEASWQASNDLSGSGKILAIRALVYFQRGMREEALKRARQALEYLATDEVIWRSMSLMVMGLDGLQQGQIKHVRTIFEQVSSLWLSAGNKDARDGIAILLGLLCLEQGDLRQAAYHYSQQLAHLDQVDQQPVAASAHLGLAYIYYEWNRLDEARQQLQAGLRLIELFTDIPQDLLATMTELLHGLLQHGQGETQRALERLKTQLKREIEPSPDNPFYFYMYHEALAWIVRLSLLLGDQHGAQEWILELTHQHHHAFTIPITHFPAAPVDTATGDALQTEELPSLYQHKQLPVILQEGKALLEARLYVAQGQLETAIELLNQLLPVAHEAGRGRHTLQIRLLLAQAYMARKQTAESRAILLVALTQAYAGGYQRLILDEGDQLFLLLRDLLPELPRQPLRSYVQSMLRSFVQQRRQITITPIISTIYEPLSRREQKVLRLLIAGHSNPEIAHELSVSVNTVRTQIQSIYRKLQVNNRQAASEVARELQIL